MAVSATKADIGVRRASCAVTVLPILSERFGMMEHRLAFPVRSPRPLMVPCTMEAPAETAAKEFATASSPSL